MILCAFRHFVSQHMAYLKPKLWGWVLIEKLKPVDFNNRAFQQLQMDITIKLLIKALVEGFQSP